MRVLLLAVLLSACAGTADHADETHTAACPFTGDAVNPKVAKRQLGKEPVGFCCGKCLAKWDGLTKDEKRDLVGR